MKSLSIITGGSSGLGLSLAGELVSRGSNIAIIGRNYANLCKAKESIENKCNMNIFTFCGDITNEVFVKSIFEELEKDGWRVDTLYNCAGVGRFGKPEENNRNMIDVALGASLIGTILMCTSAIQSMREFGGTIVNVMSTAALKGNSNESVYCAAKWGARGYTEAIKAYLKGTNIKVVGVYPGGMNTPFWSVECGMQPNTEKFMNPNEVANVIIDAVESRNTMYISDLTVDRK